MSQQDHHMHSMEGFVEDSADAIPLRMGNSLQGSGNGFVERNVPPPDQRPPALGYASFPGTGRESPLNPLLEPYSLGDRLMDRPLNARPHEPPSMTKQTSMPEYSYLERSNTDSPAQRARSSHSLGAAPTSGHTFLRPESTSEDALASPRTDRLPSFRQLSKIADGGTEGNESRVTGLANISTYPGQIVTQTTATSHPHFTQPAQVSPSSSFMHLGHPSPTHTRGDGIDIYSHSHSPATYSGPSSFPQPARRTNGSARPPTFTTSSSGETTASLQSHQSSEAGGYSTNQSTPVESTPSSLDSTPRPPLPGPMRSNSSTTSAPSGFSCDYPGCNAPPFQTQYLLNSHANVHSSNRPHYCPVKGCPRSEGGKGFKRKNEMIRHGLVHDSPGYVCPFCPLREHKYPRPDNLQRHVRVHHVDKDKDDPLLREVLAQRPEGGGRGRRRRTGPM